MTIEIVSVENGKYTLEFDTGKFRCLRYGEPWRDLTGDKMVLCLMQRIQELQKMFDTCVIDNVKLEKEIESYKAAAPINEKLHKFVNAAAGEGLILEGVDAADLYIELFPERYKNTITQIDGDS